MSRIESRDLGEAGRAYVSAHLANINLFCTALIESFNAAPGQVFTLAPADTPLERLLDFELGGLLPENVSHAGAVALPDGSTLAPVASLAEERVGLLQQAMRSLDGSVCVTDDANARWSERPPYRATTAFGVGDDVYHLLTLNNAEDEFARAVSGKALWHHVAAVCGIAPKLDGARTSTPSELRRSAAAAVLITCTAYDGEGFVAWRPATA